MTPAAQLRRFVREYPRRINVPSAALQAVYRAGLGLPWREEISLALSAPWVDMLTYWLIVAEALEEQEVDRG